MSSQRKTAIVTGASQGIGAGIVKAFVERGYNVVANSRKVTQSTEVTASDRVGANCFDCLLHTPFRFSSRLARTGALTAGC